MIERIFKGTSWYKRKDQHAGSTTYVLDTKCSIEVIYEDIKNSLCRELGNGKTWFLPFGGPLMLTEDDKEWKFTVYKNEFGGTMLKEEEFSKEAIC